VGLLLIVNLLNELLLKPAWAPVEAWGWAVKTSYDKFHIFERW
jgi:hypothetical protein